VRASLWATRTGALAAMLGALTFATIARGQTAEPPQPAPAEQLGTPAPAPAPTAPPPAPAAPPAAPASSGPITVPVDLPGRLAAGSEAGAGLDPASTGEIVHPTNPAALIASVRKLGGILDGDEGSAVVQLNPYLLLGAQGELYDEVVAQRTKFAKRLLQDSSLTLVAGQTAVPPPAGTVPVAPQERPHFGVGLSLELLGERSIYGDIYAKCVKSQTEGGATSPLAGQIKRIPPEPRPRKPSESDEEYRQRIADQKVAYDRAVSDIIESASKHVRGCFEQTAVATDALVLSAGGRWLLAKPGLPGQDPRRDRAYAALAYEHFTTLGLEFTFQVRGLEELSYETGEKSELLDAGLSLRWASRLAALGAEATKDVAGDGSLATIAGSVTLQLGNDWMVNLGLRGEGNDFDSAFDHATIVVSVSFAGTASRSIELTGARAAMGMVSR
jgi:hypothetical protein